MKNIILKIYNTIIRFKTILIPIAMLLIIPTVSSFILGYEFRDNVVKHVPAIIVDHDNSTLSQNLVKQIDTNETFDVKKYSQNDDEVKNLMDQGKVLVGIIIPENFSKDLINGKAPKVMAIYDGTQTSGVGATKGRISEVLGTIKAGYLVNIAEGKLGVMPDVVKNSIAPIQYNSKFIGNPSKSTPIFMLEGILIGIAQIGIVTVGIIISRKENPLQMIIKSILFGIIGSISILSALMVQVKYFEVPYRGSVKAAVILTILYSIGMTSLGVVLGQISKSKEAAISSALGLVSATVLLSGYTYPIIAMPDVFATIVKYVPFTHYGITIRDLSLIGLSFNDVISDIFWTIKFILVMWLVIVTVFGIDKLAHYGRKYINKNNWIGIFKRRKINEFSKSNN